MNFYKKAMMAEGGEMPEYGMGGSMPEYAEGGQMSEGGKQLQMLKAAYDKAVEEKNMEMVGKIETVIADMYKRLDDRGKEMVSDMFPQMDFMVRSEDEGPQEMAAGGKLKMVKNDKGEMVPFYAADGKGRMAYGGEIKAMPVDGELDLKKLSYGDKQKLYKSLNAELNAAKSSRYASVKDQERDVASLERRLADLKKFMPQMMAGGYMEEKKKKKMMYPGGGTIVAAEYTSKPMGPLKRLVRNMTSRPGGGYIHMK